MRLIKNINSKLLKIVVMTLIITSLLSSNYVISSAKSTGEYGSRYIITNSLTWKNSDRPQRLELCQLSQNELKNISTVDLIDDVTTNPFFIDILAYDSYQKGVEAFISEYNGAKELFSRKDLGKVTLELYSNMKLDDNLNSVFKSMLCEIILGQTDFACELSKQQSDKYNSTLANKFNQKCNDKYYSGFEDVFYDVLSDNFENIGEIVETPDLGKAESSSSDSTVSANYTTCTVYTPNRTGITAYNFTADTDYSDSVKTSLKNSCLAAYPNAEFISEATQRYNCHFYAWFFYGVPLSNLSLRWVDNPLAFISDGSASYVGQNPVYAGSSYKLIYYTDYSYTVASHSAVVVSYTNITTYKVQSKWGTLPVMKHLVYDCPYVASYLKFYVSSNGSIS